MRPYMPCSGSRNRKALFCNELRSWSHGERASRSGFRNRRRCNHRRPNELPVEEPEQGIIVCLIRALGD